MKKIIGIGVVLATALWGGYAISHSGDLDKFGCHTDHKKGDYHCHR